MVTAVGALTVLGGAERGGERAFGAFFEEHHPRVYELLFRLVGDRAEAEDLALEAFERFWTEAPEALGNAGGWVYRVAMNLGYNHLRAARRRSHYEGEVARLAIDRASAADPEREALRAQERGRVRTVLARISKRNAQLLVLRHSGFSYKEIADALKIAPASVGSLLIRAEKEFESVYTRTHGHDRG